MAESKNKLVLGYWNLQAKAQSARWLLAYHKINWEDKQYTRITQNDWWNIDKPALKSDFPNLPYIEDGDIVITESVAVLQYAALKTGNKDLLGKDLLDAIKLSQLYSFISDSRLAVWQLITNKEFEKIRDEYLNEKVAPFLNKLSKSLGEEEYLIGYLTYADFEAFTALDVLRRMSPEFLAKWPNLEKYHERFNSNDGIQAYRKSENYPKLFGTTSLLIWTGEEK